MQASCLHQTLETPHTYPPSLPVEKCCLSLFRDMTRDTSCLFLWVIPNVVLITMLVSVFSSEFSTPNLVPDTGWRLYLDESLSSSWTHNGNDCRQTIAWLMLLYSLKGKWAPLISCLSDISCLRYVVSVEFQDQKQRIWKVCAFYHM